MAPRVDDISVTEAAELLKVSDETIYRWIRQGVIPTFRVQGQYRFDRKELESWARHKRIGTPFAAEAAPGRGEERVDLLSAVRRGGIHGQIAGATPEAIFRALAGRFPFPPPDDGRLRETLATTLLEREALASTGIGHGMAIPHPRHPRDWGFGEPVVGIFFLDQPVDWKALDGEPVFVLFVSLCATVKGHLQMLAQVSHLLRNPETQAYLRTRPDAPALLERITDLVRLPADARRAQD